MNLQAIIPHDAIIQHDQHLVTSSIKVAEAFGKEHKNVTQKIRGLDCSAQFLTANFSAVKYHHNGNEYEAFEITKDGFMFLVMGFTGKKAAAIKEAYIEAFNQMAAQLYHQAPQLDQQPITPAQLYNLKQAARREAQRQGQPAAECYEKVMEVFGVNDLRELTRADYPFACSMLGTSEIEGEWLRSEMPPLPTALRYHYPKNTLKPVNSQLPNQSWLTAPMLADPDNNRPLRDLLLQLKKDGHNIEGPELEYRALVEQVRDLYWAASDAVKGLKAAMERGRPVVWE